MGAVRLKTVADLRRRRLQTAVIAVVLCLASAAATMAASILVESDGPFDRAFAAANGAHLVVSYDPGTDPRQLSATGGAPTVTASAGPWPIASGSVGVSGRRIGGLEFSGRPTPDPSIDAVAISAGRWWNAPGEAVLDQDTARHLGASVGDRIQVFPPVADKRAATTVTGRTLTVVGIAGSVSTPEVTAWMSPEDVIGIDPARTPLQQMLYRVDPSATEADLRSAIGSITSSLGAEAVSDTRTYLEVKAGVDQLADLYVPILLAFSIFALLAAAFTIANVVSGVVLTSYGTIGVMKAIGYTPAQVTAILLAQIMVPAAVGVIAGIAVGTAASMPVIEQTAASFGLPAASAVSWPVIGAVLAIALSVAAVAAIGPAIRAGRIGAVAAMTRGAAPSVRADGGRLRRLGMRLPVAIQFRLGIAAGLA
ncbi:MAG TPA: FtsX-like permease family protein, partial [Candidatus Limnocylindrales bacterium]